MTKLRDDTLNTHHSLGGSVLSRRQVVMAAAGCMATMAGVPASAGSPAKGDAIDFPSLLLIDGSRLEPTDWKGHAGVIVFWSTDCPYCKRHNARLEKLYRSIRARGSDLQVLGIATDDDAKLVRNHLAANDWNFPVALAPPGLRSKFTDRRLVPMTILIDRQGRLQLAIPGEMTEEDLLSIGQKLG